MYDSLMVVQSYGGAALMWVGITVCGNCLHLASFIPYVTVGVRHVDLRLM